MQTCVFIESTFEQEISGKVERFSQRRHEFDNFLFDCSSPSLRQAKQNRGAREYSQGLSTGSVCFFQSFAQGPGPEFLFQLCGPRVFLQVVRARCHALDGLARDIISLSVALKIFAVVLGGSMCVCVYLDDYNGCPKKN